ncbi:MAG: DUF2950 family protein [Planctomycetes bacterium]|nr:DUF2950 family protein [Planctomycetota bacterium]
MYRGDGATQIKLGLVDIALGRSDFAPATDDVFGTMPAFEDWNNVSPVSKSGYYIRILLQDVNGNNYSQNPVGTNNILATNNNFFGIMAAPAEYGSSGIRSAIVNQEGIIYQVDCGGDANKWGTTAIFTLRWPDVVPSRAQAPSGYYWGVSGD